MTALGDAIAAHLDQQHLSRSELARRLDVSAQAVSAWTRGDVQPSRGNLVRIEDELAVEPRGELLRLAGYSTSDDGEGPTVESLLRADPGIDPEDKRVLLRVLRMARERHAQAG